MLEPADRRQLALYALPAVRHRLPGGLTIYLERDDSAALLATLAGLAAPGSRIAVSFEAGFRTRRAFARYAERYYRRAGEPWRYRLPVEEAPAFFAEAGWTVESLLTGPDLDAAHLTGTPFAGRLGTGTSYTVTATR